MSYDVYLLDPVSKKVIEIEDPHFLRGGTYQLGGNKELSLNMTYNYAPILHKVLKPEIVYTEEKTGIRSLYKMRAWEAIPILEKAISVLKDDYSDDYWEATEGNAKRALINLLTLCKMRPDAVIDGD